MPLLATVSGIRGVFGDGLDPSVLTRYSSAFGAWLRQQTEARPRVVVGRDGRITGDVCARLVTATLQASGCDVIDVGLATTPSVAMGVLKHEADGAIILSASHNPAQWNALKLLNRKSEFLSPEEGAEVLELAEQSVADHTVGIEDLGSYATDDVLDYHVQAILDLPYIDASSIRERGFKVIVDGINSVGAFAIPAMLEALGVEDVEVLNAEVNGQFAHNPEPLPQHIEGITSRVAETGADLGVVVDPDADRLAFVQDGGTFFGEELTQVIAADFILGKKAGPVATNLSSSRAIEDVAARHGQRVERSPVGEIHVVRAMQAADAVIGGEGNGGVILPDLHYGRDALAGVALVLQHLAETDQSLSDVRASLPNYAIAKHKVNLQPDMDPDALLASLAERYAGGRVSTVDGVKVDLDEGWAHVRKSNTEPILRVYTEAASPEAADALAERFKAELMEG
ncbi:MAG: phosphoglucosamine mutase [Rubricoccaceae bacterium]